MSGISPWSLHERPTSFYIERQKGKCENYDRSASMLADGSSLRDVVLDILKSTYPGTFIGAKFRLCKWGSVKERFEAPLDEAVHKISELQPTESLSIPKVQLARMLRPDQLSALQHVIRSEEISKELTCHFGGYVRIKTDLSVGWWARLTPSFTPAVSLIAEHRWEFLCLSHEKMSRVLHEPGVVTQISNPQSALRARVTVGWSLGDATFSIRVHPSDLEFASPPTVNILCGSTVQLLHPDASHHISIEDVGVVKSISDDGNIEVCFPQCFKWKGDLTMVAAASGSMRRECAEVCITVKYDIWGSICAQKMGWGKTTLMVALIKYMWQKAKEATCISKEIPPQSTSLVLSPKAIFVQWLSEMRTWLGEDPGKGSTGTASWIKTKEGLKIWAPMDFAAFKKHSAEAFSADVVVLPLSLFDSAKFPSESDPWPENLFDVFGKKWSRVILDEAHELTRLPAPVQRRILKVQSRAVHALSATPEQGGGSLGAASLALAFNVSLCPMTNFAFTFDSDVHVKVAAQDFFRSVAFTQASPFQLPVEENVVWVHLTEPEKVLYAHAVNIMRSSTENLLDLCCCFISGDASSAKKEICILIKNKRRQLHEQLGHAKGHAALLLLLANYLKEEHWLKVQRLSLKPRGSHPDLWEEGRRASDVLFQELEGLESQELVKAVKSKHSKHIHGLKSQALFGISEATKHSYTANALFFEKINQFTETHAISDEQLHGIKEVFQEQLNEHLAQYYVAIGGAKKSLDFLERNMKEIVTGGGSCPICLDDLNNGEATWVTSCGHAFHGGCIEDARRNTSRCPTCRQPVSELFAMKSTPVDPWLKYGSKVQTMIRKLKDIMLEYPDEKLLLFVQYRNIREKLARAFKEFKVPFLTLCGSAHSQGAVISRWQNDQDQGDFLMMLSCEEHNAGITLTRARCT
jgi:hypothetical protein